MGVPFEALIPYGIMLAVSILSRCLKGLLTSLILDVWHYGSRYGKDQAHAERRQARAPLSRSMGQGIDPYDNSVTTLSADAHIANDGP